ncbi:MAG: cell division protein FtsA [Alphaproteobacteria bacterium]
MPLFDKKVQRKHDKTFAALDVGASKVCFAIARIDSQNDQKFKKQIPFKITGIGYQKNKGVKNGVIIDLEALEESISSAIEAAENSSSKTVDSVYVNIPSVWTSSHFLTNEIYLGDKSVSDIHLQRLLGIDHETSIPQTHQIIHILPISYELDDILNIRDPSGMVGRKLVVHLHVISAPSGLIRNLVRCIGNCRLDVEGCLVSSYASGISTLVDDEKELGVTVIDMGGGCTSMASFYEDRLINIQNIPVGGITITNDIARSIGTPITQAERLKILYGASIPLESDKQETILVQQMGEHNMVEAQPMARNLLIQIIQSRVEEIFELIQKNIESSRADPIVFQRFVLTGGGSQLSGLRDLMASFFGKQIRIASPFSVSGGSDIVNTPIFSTCAGLLQYAFRDSTEKEILYREKSNVWNRFRLWLKENF